MFARPDTVLREGWIYKRINGVWCHRYLVLTERSFNVSRHPMYYTNPRPVCAVDLDPAGGTFELAINGESVRHLFKSESADEWATALHLVIGTQM